jgi:UDP-N-acetylglucosamine:LPS N-acetylglucosamine transferase
MERAADEIESLLGACAPASGPPTLAFLVGGAGAQLGLARRVVRGLAPLLLGGRLRLLLVAGVRDEVRRSFAAAITAAGLDRLRDDEGNGAIEVLYRPEMVSYLQHFNHRLADVDVAWTKPSEMSFYAALGLPLILAPPIGMHEDYNRRWVKEAGAGTDQREPEQVAHWLSEWLEDGTLAGMAWAGYRRLPQEGLYRIVEEVRGAVVA